MACERVRLGAAKSRSAPTSRARAARASVNERIERLGRVIATAEYVWDGRDEAKRFLTTPHPAFAGARPIDATRSELGARQVEELLWQIYHGLAA